MATVYERAFLPEGAEGCLPDRLTIDELAYLRAGYFGGVYCPLYEELKTRMNSMVRAGLFHVEDRVEEITNISFVKQVPKKDAFGAQIEPIEYIEVTYMSGSMDGFDRKTEVVGVITHHDVVTREAALALRLRDSKDWSDGSQLWLGISLTGSFAVHPGALEGPSPKNIWSNKKIEEEFGPQRKNGNPVSWKSVWATVGKCPDLAKVKAKHGHYHATELRSLLVDLGYAGGGASGRQYISGKPINATEPPRSGRG